LAHDPWKHVFRNHPGFSATASSREDARGAAIGLAFNIGGLERVHGERSPVEIDPLAMQLAVESDEFLAEFMALMFHWGIAVPDREALEADTIGDGVTWMGSA
jgi:hypothetical protein